MPVSMYVCDDDDDGCSARRQVQTMEQDLLLTVIRLDIDIN